MEENEDKVTEATEPTEPSAEEVAMFRSPATPAPVPEDDVPMMFLSEMRPDFWDFVN